MTTGVMLIASHGRSLAACALLDALARGAGSYHVAGVVIVKAVTPRRLREWSRRYGRELPWKIMASLGVRGRARFDDEHQAYVRHLVERGVTERSVPALAKRRGIPVHHVEDLNDARAIDVVRASRATVGVYGGGGIVRRGLINAFPAGLLNNHSGPLPQVRGMNAVEWSVLLGAEPTATIHLIDDGIDTGAVLEATAVPLLHGEPLGALRARVVLRGIDLIVSLLQRGPAAWSPRANSRDAGRQYYMMSESMRARVEERLAAHASQGAAPREPSAGVRT